MERIKGDWEERKEKEGEKKIGEERLIFNV